MSANNTYFLWILLSLLLLLNLADLTAVSRSCSSQCGGIHIPYPFGMGIGCYLEKWYEIKCVSTSVSGEHVPVLAVIGKEVVNFSLPDSVLIKNNITSKGCSSDGEEEFESLLNLTGTPFYVSSRNTLIAAGCNITASLTNVESSMVGCNSRCGKKSLTPTQDFLALSKCYGIYEYDDTYCNERIIAGRNSCSGIGCLISCEFTCF